MKGIYLDSESQVVEERCAVVFAPRRGRKRFPENCVQLVADEAAARQAAAGEDHRYAARVLGPSRSSEGLRLYYLVRWLD